LAGFLNPAHQKLVLPRSESERQRIRLPHEWRHAHRGGKSVLEAFYLKRRSNDIPHSIATGKGVLGNERYKILDIGKRSMTHSGMLAKRQRIIGGGAWQVVDLRAQRVTPPHRSCGFRPLSFVDINSLQLICW